MKKYTFFSFLIFILGSLTIHAQIPHKEIVTIRENGVEIHFLLVSENPEIRKSVLVFCGGSFPGPLLIEEGEQTHIAYYKYFAYDGILEDYHVVIIGKPNTSPVAKKEELSELLTTVTDISDPYSFHREFLENNYLENHVQQTVAVLKFLKTMDCVDESRILLLGHSQGAHIAAHVALECTEIVAIGYFGGNPFGRYAQFVIQERYKEIRGESTMEDVQWELEGFYSQWRNICRGTERESHGDPDHTWKSFSGIYIDKLTSISSPLFVAYGTKDPGGHLCYLLPIYFELAGKKNYKMRPFIDRGHNFEKYDEQGKSLMHTSLWLDASREFIKWSENYHK